MENYRQLKAINFDQFIKGVSLVASQGYNNQTKSVIPNEVKIYFDCLLEYYDNHEFIDKLNIPLNQVIGYCWLLLKVCKNLESDHVDGKQIDKEHFEYVKWCIGDITSKVSSNKDLKMAWIFTIQDTKYRIIASLMILSKLPFENDDERRKFNKLVEYYKSSGGEKLEYLAYDNPGHCYIATMVYGNYEHPSVIVLRKYRDEVLSKIILGEIFIKLYYKISPKIVNLLKDNKKINQFIKKILDLFVKTLI